jgi:hypothetical protein
MPMRVIKKDDTYCKYEHPRKGCEQVGGPCSARLLGMQLTDCKMYEPQTWGAARRLCFGRKVA